MAPSVPCPNPVRAKDPYNLTCSLCTCSRTPRSYRLVTESFAARIGPTVWELDGPIPTLKISKKLVFTAVILFPCSERLIETDFKIGRALDARSTTHRYIRHAGFFCSNPSFGLVNYFSQGTASDKLSHWWQRCNQPVYGAASGPGTHGHRAGEHTGRI